MDTTIQLYVANVQAARGEDYQLISSIPVLFGAGVSEGEILRMARVWGESRKVSQFQSPYLHHSIEEPFRQRGERGTGVLGLAITQR
jgi:hypothetical protein